MLTPLGSPSVPSLNPFQNPSLGAGLGSPNLGLPGLGGMSTDGFGMSPEAAQGGLSNAGDLSALMQSLGAQMDPKQMRVMQLQQEMQQVQEAMAVAQASGNQPMAEQLQQRLQQIQAELQQLMGGEGQPGGGGADPMSGLGSPAGGEAPMGGSPGGGSPGGGSSPGGAAPSGGSPGSSPGGSPGGNPSGPSGSAAGPSQASNSAPAGPGTANASPSPSLQGDDAKMAAAIEQQLQGTPLANQGLGAHFVAAGRQRNVDPMALVAISKHETNHGKLGVGIKKHMGVGAYDNNPNGRTPFDGAVQQIYSGAKTFDNLRRKGGSNAGAPMSSQLAAVNRAGWATDRNWHSKVGRSYNTVVSRANQSGGTTQVAQNRTPRSNNRT